MRNQQAHQRPTDGIEADEGVVGQENQGEQDLAELAPDRADQPAQMHRQRQFPRFAKSSTVADNKPGRVMIARTNSGPMAPRPGSSSQLPSSSNSRAAGTRLRRRLSRIFHCDKPESGLAMRRASGPGTRGKSHWVICQSPRIQRWRRSMSML